MEPGQKGGRWLLGLSPRGKELFLPRTRAGSMYSIDAQDAQNAHPLPEPFGEAGIGRTPDAHEPTNI